MEDDGHKETFIFTILEKLSVNGNPKYTRKILHVKFNLIKEKKKQVKCKR